MQGGNLWRLDDFENIKIDVYINEHNSPYIQRLHLSPEYSLLYFGIPSP